MISNVCIVLCMSLYIQNGFKQLGNMLNENDLLKCFLKQLRADRLKFLFMCACAFVLFSCSLTDMVGSACLPPQYMDVRFVLCLACSSCGMCYVWVHVEARG